MVKVTDIGLLKPEHPIFSEGCTVNTGGLLRVHKAAAGANTDGTSLYDTEPEEWQRPEPRLSDVQEAAAMDVMMELVDAYQEGGKEAVGNRFLQLMKEKREAEENQQA